MTDARTGALTTHYTRDAKVTRARERPLTRAHTWNFFLMSSKKENATRLSPSAKRSGVRARANECERPVRAASSNQASAPRSGACLVRASSVFLGRDECMPDPRPACVCSPSLHAPHRCSSGANTAAGQRHGKSGPLSPNSSLTVDAGWAGQCWWYAGYAWGVRGGTPPEILLRHAHVRQAVEDHDVEDVSVAHIGHPAIRRRDLFQDFARYAREVARARGKLGEDHRLPRHQRIHDRIACGHQEHHARHESATPPRRAAPMHPPAIQGPGSTFSCGHYTVLYLSRQHHFSFQNFMKFFFFARKTKQVHHISIRNWFAYICTGRGRRRQGESSEEGPGGRRGGAVL
jgi:hypothetical protein